MFECVNCNTGPILLNELAKLLVFYSRCIA
uniref:Uncharacterized protein n=1 Tax=Myoviridae sp. ctJ2i1 TaxID=2825079 RepID=A0A8S5V1X7_9CAUD|nr:MAG TPA: hypothetical protein [Myoviridae sp. ctJ2i1]DAV32878.1 MAG TPA: hypothetical protein [Caudoviricetes sp.]DAW79624.1 MAG TPA: hypothetical protein [Caudoviricetes sp.]